MIESLKNTAFSHGDCLEIVPVTRLKDLQRELETFQAEEELNGFQKWIVEKLYSLDIPDTAFSSPIQSILLIAMPHPAYAEVFFTHHGKEYMVFGLVNAEQKKTEAYLSAWFKENGYHMIPAPNLPFKRLAVHCGLAKYGKNNITYVDGMGSHLSYLAYFTDIPCDETNSNTNWRNVLQADVCKNCDLCRKNCPTGALKENCFLLDNTRCLSATNEMAEDFPSFVPPTAHHTIYDCLKCQVVCPMNIEGKPAEPIYFDETETNSILEGAPYLNISEETEEKIARLALDKWGEAVPRNLRLLFDLMDEGHVPTLTS